MTTVVLGKGWVSYATFVCVCVCMCVVGMYPDPCSIGKRVGELCFRAGRDYRRFPAPITHSSWPCWHDNRHFPLSVGVINTAAVVLVC